MKKVVNVVEVEEAGLITLLGKHVLVFAANYIYTGILSGVNDTCLELSEPKIVYQTGAFSNDTFEDAQSTGSDVLFVQTNAIESVFETKKRETRK